MDNSRNLRIPGGVWSWRTTGIVAVVVAVMSLATIRLGPDARSLAEQAVVSGLVVYPVVLISALLLYLHGRLTGHHGSSWLSALLLAACLKWVAAAGIRAAYPELALAQSSTFLLVDLLFILLALAILRKLSHRPPPFDAAVLGFLMGLTFGGVRLGLAAGGVELPASPAVLTAGIVLLLCLNLAFVYTLAARTHLPFWAQARLVAAIVLLSGGVAAANPVIQSSLQGTWVLVSAYLGSALLACTSLALARLAVRDTQAQVHELRGQVTRSEAESRDSHERLHEISATVAGIAIASRLIGEEELPLQKKGMLQDMMGSELARLERLMDDQGAESRDFDLDATIRPLIVAQRTLGQPVTWTPSGAWGHGRPDDTAEVLNVLLKNAARHAPGAPVRVHVCHPNDGGLEIHVSDNGPGVPRELAAQLFEWGVRHPRSPGQGIGLSVARRLMEDQGGFLRLVSTAAPIGTLFVVGLPSSGRGHDVAYARAE